MQFLSRLFGVGLLALTVDRPRATPAGIVTGIIGDIATVFSCIVGLDPETAGIFLVALGLISCVSSPFIFPCQPPAKLPLCLHVRRRALT